MFRNLRQLPALLLALALGSHAQAATPPPAYLNPHAIDELVKATKTGDDTAISQLIDAILSSSILTANASGALRKRLTDAEGRYRRGSGEFVGHNQFVSAFNSLGAELGLPAFTTISAQQLAMVRIRQARVLPNLLLPTKASSDPQLSPSAAIYLALSLIQFKLTNADYRLSASDWVQKYTQPATSRTPPGTAPYAQQEVRIVGADESEFATRVATAGPGGESALSGALWNFIGALGIP